MVVDIVIIDCLLIAFLGVLLFLTRRPGPDMQLQRAVYEKDNLKLHLCNGVFEAYSAAYLTTKQHMIEGEYSYIWDLLPCCVQSVYNDCVSSEKSDRFNLSWVNCEMASFVYMRQSNR